MVVRGGIVFFILCILSCDSRGPFLPKPRAYPRVEYPEKKYQPFKADYCSMTFDYPVYAEIIKDELFFDDKPAEECWFDIKVDAFDCKIHCSYYPIQNTQHFDRLLNDAFKLAGKHSPKADYIDEAYFENDHNAVGFVFKLTGPVASPYQFFVTDSTDHFLRGAMYFNTQARPDSLAPIVDFMKEDLDVLLQSFRWQ